MRFSKLFLFCVSIFFVNISFGMKDQAVAPADKFKLVKKIELNRNNCKAISKNGKYIATVLGNSFVQVIDVETNREVCSYQHHGQVQCIFFSKCERFVLSGTIEGEGAVFDIEKNECIHLYKDKKNRPISYVSLSVDEERVAYGFLYGGIEVFCRETDKKIFSHEGCDGTYAQPFLDKYGMHVVYQQEKGQYSVFNIDAQREVFSYKIRGCSYFFYAELSDDGRYLVISFKGVQGSISLCLNIKIFDVIRKEKLWSFRSEPKSRLFACLSKDGRYFMVTSCEGEVMVFDTKKRKPVHFYKHKNSYRAWLSISNDGQEIISVNKTGQIIKHKISENFCVSQRQYILDKDDRKCRIASIKDNDFQVHNVTIALEGENQQKKLNCCKSLLMS